MLKYVWVSFIGYIGWGAFPLLMSICKIENRSIHEILSYEIFWYIIIFLLLITQYVLERVFLKEYKNELKKYYDQNNLPLYLFLHLTETV